MLKEILDEIEDLFSELMQDVGDLLFDDFDYSSMGAYAECPSCKLEIDEEPEPEEQGDEEQDEKEEEQNEPIPAQGRTFSNPYIGDVEIRKVPRYFLGYNVIGRAFPYLRVIEIASDLYGDEFEEVKVHEMIHIKQPELSEWQVRMKTRGSLTFTSKWN